jgi:2-keto-3-deoxy-6-phosphogluconate aldolase
VSAESPAGPLATITGDRVVSVVRADRSFDIGSLLTALTGGGIRAVELTLTTPGILTELAGTDLSRVPGAVLGVGTVLTAEQADDAIDAGARFLVTPCLSEDVASAAAAREVPVIMGVLSPTEVRAALEAGAAAVKVFPARAGLSARSTRPVPRYPADSVRWRQRGQCRRLPAGWCGSGDGRNRCGRTRARGHRTMGGDHRASRDIRRSARRPRSDLT